MAVKFVGSSWHMMVAKFDSGPQKKEITTIHVSNYKMNKVIHLKTCVSRKATPNNSRG